MGKPQYAAGLDAGSSHTRCLIGLVENSHVRLLGGGIAESDCWLKGRLADQRGLTESVRGAVAEAERTAGVSVDSVVAGIGGVTVQGANYRGVYEMGRPREIDAVDVRYAVEKAARVQLPSDRVLLHVFPQDFAVDGRAGYRNPRGIAGSRLEAFVHLITASAQEHQSLIGAVNHASLEVEDTMYEPLAAAYAAILPEQREQGTALVDIGSHSTDMVVYLGEALLHSASLAVSGDHFTRDLCHRLSVSFEDGRQLKEECGCAILGLTSDNCVVAVPSPDDRPPRETTRYEMNRVLEARARELFLFVRREIANSGMEEGLMDGIVLAGDGANLPGMCDMAEQVLNCEARNGLPAGIEDWPADLNDPAWTTAAGLMMYSARLKGEDGEPGFFGRLFR